MLRSSALLAAGLGLSCLGLSSLTFVACSSSECSGDECGVEVVDSGPEIEAGPVCEPDADPKDEPGCVNDEFGVFVDKERGLDSNAGTKASPFKSINGAVEKSGDKKRIFVCQGNYFEHVLFTKPLSIHGGFNCETWAYDGSKVRLAPNDEGYIIETVLVAEPIAFSDLVLEAVAPTTPGSSSIAMFLTRSSHVTLRRMSLNAGLGTAGKDGEDFAEFVPPSAPDGWPGDDPTETGGSRTNPSCPTSIGGAGGRDGTTGGRDGKVSIPSPFPEENTGIGGLAETACDQGGAGVDGAFGGGGTAGAGAQAFGSLDTTGWKPTGGGAGGKGGDGQGGGGGGQITPGAVGGGGAPGGCGGSGGPGGMPGGSSIALLVFDSSVVIDDTLLIAQNGGRGGSGAKGQKAQLASVNPAAPSVVDGACHGGLGGVGGSGGGGGGGAGGLSVGVLYKGAPPTIDGVSTPEADSLSSVRVGIAGAAGESGAGGEAVRSTAPASKAGENGGEGIAGVAKAVVAIP